ncbi:MAG: FUSC family protein, partial [Acidimicrobiales bacterium]
IGALWAVSQDGLDDWRVRGNRILGVALGGGVGFALGAALIERSAATWALALFSGVVALVAGFVESSGWPTQGAYLLLGSILGAGLGVTGPVWRPSLCLFAGALLLYVVGALMDRQGRLANQRVYLAAAFTQLASVVQLLGTPSFYKQRASAVGALDRAQDLVGGARRRSTEEEIALRECLIVALRCGEVISYLEGKDLRVDVTVSLALQDVAETLDTSTGVAALVSIRQLPALFRSATGLDDSITSAMVLSDATRLRALALRPPVPGSLRNRLPLIERARFGVVLAVAVVAGVVVSRILDGPHGFWLPLSVAMIFRPDLGPVVPRAVARTLGTVVGVGIAAFVAWHGHTVIDLIVLACLMSALTPWAVRKSHFLGVLTFTPLVFVFLTLAGDAKHLLVPRIVDTAVGAAIVLILDVMLWSTAPSLRPAPQLAAAQQALDRYQLDAPADDPIRRNVLRRNALRAVARARSSFEQARREPPLLRRHDPTTAAELNAVEAGIDARTVALFDGD